MPQADVLARVIRSQTRLAAGDCDRSRFATYAPDTAFRHSSDPDASCCWPDGLCHATRRLFRVDLAEGRLLLERADWRRGRGYDGSLESVSRDRGWAVSEIDSLLGQLVPAVEAAVGVYGIRVLSVVEDEAANETVRLGQRLLDRIVHRGAQAEPVRVAVADLAQAATGTPDSRRAQFEETLREVLGHSPTLVAELAALLPQRPTAQASGAGSVSVVKNSGIISTGEGATIHLHQ